MYKLNVFFALAVAFGLILAGCDSGGINDPEPEGPDVVEVSAVHDHEAGEHLFDLATNEVPSGWTTFRFDNQGHQPHFLILEKMPVVDGDQKTVEDSKAEVVPVFQNVMDDINGKEPSFPDAGFELPEWYSDVAFVGGPGITSADETSATTVNLEPVYGIILAAMIFGESEKMHIGFYVGASIILLSVLAHPVLNKQYLRRQMGSEIVKQL